MPTRDGNNSNNVIDLTTETSTPPAGWPENQAWWSVNAMGGDDIVYGSIHNDSIRGGDGADELYGNNGNDGLYGDAGDDYLNGGNGEDWLDGGIGDDILIGGANDDWLTAGDGNDIIDAGTGDDALIGGAGNDQLFGGSGHDQFYGDAGADVLDGGAGDDRLWGNSGNDQYQYNGQGWDVVNDGVTNTETPRTDSTYDTADRLIVSYTTSELEFFSDGANGLVITSTSDIADNVIDNCVIIENYFAGGHYVVEILQTADGAFYLPDYFPPAVA